MSTQTITYELKTLVKTDMREAIDKDIIGEVLSKDPFISVPGVINIRDIGVNASPYLRRGLVYRSGALHKVDGSSIALLKDTLGIKLILDLRVDCELEKQPTPAIEGVRNVHLNATRQPKAKDMSTFIESGGKKGFVSIYGDVLEVHQPSIRYALEWIRDEGTPLLFHCTAGKDRTGVLAAVILGLAGVPKDVIADDYVLSRLGIEPSREVLLAMLKVWDKGWTAETPGMAEFAQVKAEFMLATLEMVDEKYGGMEGYVKRELGFSDEDVEKIKKNLRGE
ncbi:protein-tyrosine phosphatase-like protein [Lophiotrema nucula]|uniref:Protein-tyrosine phosphatase-like protein n=1 Tax=Lophiotrema nucula TaxID=690887 RepID=A0A6A5ZE91_9PLEO|nr:protein-tyrosine phosphatase-like protein [Lophiotrema nucula]